MDSLSVDHLLGIKYLNKNDIELILRTAETFSEVLSRPIKKVPSLNGVTVANLFFENSTRTRTSFTGSTYLLSARDGGEVRDVQGLAPGPWINARRFDGLGGRRRGTGPARDGRASRERPPDGDH